MRRQPVMRERRQTRGMVASDILPIRHAKLAVDPIDLDRRARRAKTDADLGTHRQNIEVMQKWKQIYLVQANSSQETYRLLPASSSRTKSSLFLFMA